MLHQRTNTASKMPAQVEPLYQVLLVLSISIVSRANQGINLVSPSRQNVHVNDTVPVTCSSLTSPISWRADGVCTESFSAWLATGKMSIREQRNTTTGLAYSTLTIAEVAPQHSCVFTCFLAGTAHSASSTVHIVVTPKLSIQNRGHILLNVLSADSLSLERVLGESVTCACMSSLPARVSWLDTNKMLVTESARFRLSSHRRAGTYYETSTTLVAVNPASARELDGFSCWAVSQGEVYRSEGDDQNAIPSRVVSITLAPPPPSENGTVSTSLSSVQVTNIAISAALGCIAIAIAVVLATTNYWQQSQHRNRQSKSTHTEMDVPMPLSQMVSFDDLQGSQTETLSTTRSQLGCEQPSEVPVVPPLRTSLHPDDSVPAITTGGGVLLKLSNEEIYNDAYSMPNKKPPPKVDPNKMEANRRISVVSESGYLRSMINESTLGPDEENYAAL
ncbi:uncharacterized protein LOC135827525 [Sycon ciliatum]|uniref:uncharacterized protein LOC135827525 n=1 Tax=Sycon ciliatum TaxID=27933 RepID=UPI0031F6B938|eukprot:scpid69901/ scgid30527/ 